MIRSSRKSKAHLSKVADRTSQGEAVLIAVNGEARAKLVDVAKPDFVQDGTSWRQEPTAINRKHLGRAKGTPMADILDTVREDRF
ncbi:MAG: hypothetical protein ACKV22_30300 [Bryobacteraceae bacterium]